METTKLPENIRIKAEPRGKSLDRIRGCMFGGATGDALGYPVEFLGIDSIHDKYGPSGITSYVKDPVSRLALVSDDTQTFLSEFVSSSILINKPKTFAEYVFVLSFVA